MNSMIGEAFNPVRKCRRLSGAILVAATASLCAPAAWAANASDLTVTLDVKPFDPATATTPSSYSVSVSRAGLDSFISYRFHVFNSSTNTVNQVSIAATATVTGTVAVPVQGLASYAGVVNIGGSDPNCPSPGATPTNTVSCSIGQLKSGDTRDFFLLFRAPEGGVTVEFAGDTAFSEGNSSNSPPANFTALVSNSMGLTTTNSDEVNKSVKTVLPPAGGSFFTGPNGQANSANLFTTTVSLPPVAGVVSDNRIDQASLPSYTCSAITGYFCYGLSSTIQINSAKDETNVVLTPGGPVITILLRQDAASLTVKKPTPSVNDVKIFFTPDGGSFPGVIVEVPGCSGSLPLAYQPCVSARRDFLKGQKGYYEYEIHALDNGNFSW